MTEEEIQEEQDDDTICSGVASLAGALSNLMEIDGGFLSKKRQATLARMKRQIFDSLSYYCECLPQLENEDQKD